MILTICVQGQVAFVFRIKKKYNQFAFFKFFVRVAYLYMDVAIVKIRHSKKCMVHDVTCVNVKDGITMGFFFYKKQVIY